MSDVVSVFGSSGFIGNRLAHYLDSSGYSVRTFQRGDAWDFDGPLGTIFWCIGLTANFRNDPAGTVEAHAGLPAKILQNANYDRFVYLSSTRVYAHQKKSDPDLPIQVQPHDVGEIYNISKLAGENLTLNNSVKSNLVLRLSNVVGPGEFTRQTFIGQILQEAFSGVVNLKSHMNTKKDYVWIDDAIALIAKSGLSDCHGVYNLASGVQISHEVWLNEFAKLLDFDLHANSSAEDLTFPEVDISKTQKRFSFEFTSPLEKIKDIVRKA